MTAPGWHDEVKAAADNVEAHTAEVDRLLADPAGFAAGPGDWMRRFEQACAVEEEAVNGYGSAVLWADMDVANAHHPAPQEPEAGQ